MTRIESAEKITNAMRILEKEKGNKAFTAREYKQLGKDIPSLQTLRDKRLIKVNNSETFTKNIPNSSSECYIYNNKHQAVMKWRDYEILPKIAQEALVKANNGEAFEIKCPDEITITCKRYYYAADYDEMADFAKREREYFLTKKEEKEQELIEINNKIEKLEEIFK